VPLSVVKAQRVAGKALLACYRQGRGRVQTATKQNHRQFAMRLFHVLRL